MNGKKQFVTIDELTSGNLPHRILDAVSQMDMSVNEIVNWERSKPTFHITLSDGHLHINVRKQYSLKKILAISGSILGVVWAILQFAIPYFA